MNTKKFIALTLSALMLAGCGSASEPAKSEAPAQSEAPAATSAAAESEKPAESEAPAKVSGTVTAAGSSALKPLADVAAEKFMAENPDVSVDVQGGGSGQGLKQVADGSIDIGNSDVFAAEKLDAAVADTLVDHQVCINVMGAIVNADLGIDSLSTDDLVGIFTGKITNWKEVGGPDEAITLYTRPASSGTRATFAKYAMNGAEETTGIENDNSGELVEKIAGDPSAIGYVSLANIQNNDKVKMIGIDGVAANLDNAYNGTYKVWCYEHMYTNGEGSDAAQAFINYMTSSDFEPEIEALGYGASGKLSDAAKATHAE